MDIHADFHLHTNASDGRLSPKELVKLAKSQSLSLMAITDHDTTSSLYEGILQGDRLDIKVVPGIELSTIHNDESIHILGYFTDDSYKDPNFQNLLSEIQDYRIYRAKKMVSNLDEFFNIKLDYEDVKKTAKGVVARPHIAKAIIDKGYPYTFQYIFENIIDKDSVAYVQNKKISLLEGINLLRDLNAIVILAHPKLIKKTPIEDIIKLNFHGLEAIYYLNSLEEQEKYINIALKNNKLISCGSDFHGIENDVKHGYIGSMDSTLKELEDFINIFI
ncbi:metal-dependent phosphoesterase [Clostridium putrefaciens]|uniref:Metal-dependent phosphoesterase n=1 Tax=Clostridium putrefaciens TaxID=99675 RepID=A0A381JBQ0_9CLOT|nr:PHP domain-containing protein [Clostridium putrefaciens]SUY47802.1 metal-dependent phosphoesterase [Clostridium putrefaciens]